MPQPRDYYVVPEVPNVRAILNPLRGFFSVVIPLARTNRVLNPSVETNTTGYTAGAGTLIRTTDEQYHGAYSLKYTPSSAAGDGFYYGTVTTVTGQTDAISCKFKGKAGIKYKLSIATTGGSDLAARRFIATGRWQWITVLWNETSGASRRIYFTKDNNNSVAPFYVDGVQCEACEAGNFVATTYIDGDQAGLLPRQFPAPYRWNGTPHASTSTRDATTRAGGYVLNLDRFCFYVLAAFGLGLSGVGNVATTGAGSDGAQYQSTTVQSRQFAIQGVFEATTSPHLQRLRSALYDAVGPDAASPRQPLTLLYQAFEGREERGSAGRIVASYESGLEQNATAIPREEAVITFTQWLPAVYGGDAGAALAVQTSFTGNYIAQRSPAGLWGSITTGLNGSAFAVIRDPNSGVYYVGGAFTTAGGVAANRIAKYDPSTGTWSALGTGANNEVYALAVDAAGNLYAGGLFTQMGGVANTSRIAKWNGSTWSALGTGALDQSVRSIVLDANGNVYAGGYFTQMGGVANTAAIAKWNGSAWSALGTGVSGQVERLIIGPGNMLYVTGLFPSAGGVANTAYIARWSGSAWFALSTGLNSYGYALAFGPDGNLYVGGDFTTAGGVACTRIAKWNGSGFTPLGSGLNDIPYTLLMTDNGILYVGGQFTTAGGVSLSDSFAAWNGSTWIPVPDITMAGVVRVFDIIQAPDNTLTIAWADVAGTAVAAGITTVTNTGTARTYPTVRITGPSSGTARLYQLANLTTGAALYLNYTMVPGEILTIRTSPQGTTITSSAFGDQTSAILPGSSGDFALVKGPNSISLFSANSTVTALMQWPMSYNSADDLVE